MFGEMSRGRKEGKKEGRKEERKEGKKEERKEGRKEGKKEGRKEGRKEEKKGEERFNRGKLSFIFDRLPFSPRIEIYYRARSTRVSLPRNFSFRYRFTTLGYTRYWKRKREKEREKKRRSPVGEMFPGQERERH